MTGTGRAGDLASSFSESCCLYAQPFSNPIFPAASVVSQPFMADVKLHFHFLCLP